jgi:hypothetical protein
MMPSGQNNFHFQQENQRAASQIEAREMNSIFQKCLCCESTEQINDVSLLAIPFFLC